MFESCICIEPDEVSTLLSRKRPIARKKYKCVECRGAIQPGDIYERDTVVFAGDFASYKTCLTCVRIRDELLTCGWYYGGMWDDIHEAHCDPEDGECICP